MGDIPDERRGKEKGKRRLKAERLILAAGGMTSAEGGDLPLSFGFKGSRKILPEILFWKSCFFNERTREYSTG